MDIRSTKILQSVHPDLVKIITMASQQPQPFIVICGVRTIAAETEAVASGDSTTMHSRHLPDKLDGLSRAADVVALIDGVISFAKGHEQEVFGVIATSIKVSAKSLNLPVEWGGDWITFKDWGHFQLPWNSYP